MYKHSYIGVSITLYYSGSRHRTRSNIPLVSKRIFVDLIKKSFFYTEKSSIVQIENFNLI